MPCLVAALVVVLCLTSSTTSAIVSRAQRRGFRSAEHVIIFGYGGFGGMYLENATSFLPNINKFYTDGAHTTMARDQMPSIPETMWCAAKRQNGSLVVAVAESWDWIYYLVEDGIVDYNFRCKENDSLCAQEVKIHSEAQAKPMFIHFDSIDEAGHSFSWGSARYYNAVKAVDGYIGEIMAAFDKAGIYDETLFILTADHGGYLYGHGSPTQVCMYIPALFMGPQVKKGYQISGYTPDKDFAPTALNALGLHPGQYMVGKVVEEIYTT